MWRLENPWRRMLMCSLCRIRDDFIQQTSSLALIVLPKDLFSCKIHQGKTDKTYRVLVANLATNFWILVTRAVILVALATVLGAVSCPYWDENLEGEALAKWKTFINDLNALNKIRLSRCYANYSPTQSALCSYQIHGFSDASERAYAAVVFLKTEFSNCETQVTIMTSKTRVAQKKC